MALQVSKVAWTKVCLVVSQTTHDLYGLKSVYQYVKNTNVVVAWKHMHWNVLNDFQKG
jgi:hypothetical protein